MCRLFGLVSRDICDAGYWFFDAQTPLKVFSEREMNRGPHNSGWGIAYLEKGKWKIFKEGKLDVKKYNFEIIRKIESKKIFIHLRKASTGSESTRNAHPFEYSGWIFAHNGRMEINKLIPHLNTKFRHLLTSETDSEVFFYLIMQNLEETQDIYISIKDALKVVRKYDYVGLNFILSNKDKTYVYREVNPKSKELFDYYSLHYLVKDDQIIISSDSLDDNNWIKLELRQLITIDSNLELNKINL